MSIATQCHLGSQVPRVPQSPEAVHHAIQRSLDGMAPKTSWQRFKAEQMPLFLKENPDVKLCKFDKVSEWMSIRWKALTDEEKEKYRVLATDDGDQDQTARTEPDRSRSPRKASGTPAAKGGADRSKAKDAAQPQQSSALTAASVAKATEAVGEPQTDDSQATLGHHMESQGGA